MIETTLTGVDFPSLPRLLDWLHREYHRSGHERRIAIIISPEPLTSDGDAYCVILQSPPYGCDFQTLMDAIEITRRHHLGRTWTVRVTPNEFNEWERGGVH